MVTAEKPKVVTLCGSTRFADEFARQSLILGLEGKIVLSIAVVNEAVAREFGLDDPTHFGEQLGRKKELDELHFRKIDISDYILVLNVGGYIGESTRNEIQYAESIGVEVRYLEPDRPITPLRRDDR